MKTRVTQRGIVVPVLEGLEQPAGVYRLWAEGFDGVYVGSTCNLQKRAHEHWRDFQTYSQNPRLRNLFKHAGVYKVQFEVLEYFPAGSRFSRELLDAEERHSAPYYAAGRLLSDHLAYSWTNEARSRKANASTLVSLKKREGELERRLAFVRFQIAELEVTGQPETIDLAQDTRFEHPGASKQQTEHTPAAENEHILAC